MVTTLSTNEHYGALASSAAKVDKIYQLIPKLHADGCQIVFDPAKVQQANRLKQDGVDTVTVTYALYQVKKQIPSIANAKDKADAAQAVISQINAKNHKLPDAVTHALEQFCNGSPGVLGEG